MPEQLQRVKGGADGEDFESNSNNLDLNLSSSRNGLLYGSNALDRSRPSPAPLLCAEGLIVNSV